MPAPGHGSSSTSTTPTPPGALVDECRQVFGSDPVFVSEVGPVIGAHIGPGLIGFGGIDTGIWERPYAQGPELDV